MTVCRGIRGAITVDRNNRQEIKDAAKRLLVEMTDENAVMPDDIASVIFSVTDDLDASFPAEGARDLGWSYVPLFCCREMAVPGSLPRCLRILMHVNTKTEPENIKHIYLEEAEGLRPDLKRRKQP